MVFVFSAEKGMFMSAKKNIKKVFFIGDPQVSSTKPRYRIEETDAEWRQVWMNKIAFINEKAIHERAIQYYLGDMTERADDTHPELMAFYVKEAAKAKEAGLTWRVLWGNHDMRDVGPTDATVLGILSLAGLVIDMRESQLYEVVTLRPENGVIENIHIGGTPFGMALPPQVDTFNNEKVFWLTHMDVALDDTPYPGAEEPFEIPGIDYIINGHDHHTKPLKKVGETTWLTTGNILRIRRSDKDHKPVFFEWTVGMTDPQPIYLEVEQDVFNMTGKLVERAKKLNEQSEFVQDLKNSLMKNKVAQHESSVATFETEFFEVLDKNKVPLSKDSKDILKMLMDIRKQSEE